MGVTLAAGLSLRWFRDQFGMRGSRGERRRESRSHEYLSEEAASVPPGAEGLLWTPYRWANARRISIRTRAPRSSAARAPRDALHVVRAILEGVAFEPAGHVRKSSARCRCRSPRDRLGGGARSPIWRQIQADVFGHDAEIVEAEEGAAYGAALLAGVGS